MIQISGRLARRPEDNAVFITVVPKRHTVRGDNTAQSSLSIIIEHSFCIGKRGSKVYEEPVQLCSMHQPEPV